MIIRNFYNGTEWQLDPEMAERVRKKIAGLSEDDRQFLEYAANKFNEEFGVVETTELIENWPAKILEVGRAFTRNKKFELKTTHEIFTALHNSGEIVFHAFGQNCSWPFIQTLLKPTARQSVA